MYEFIEHNTNDSIVILTKWMLKIKLLISIPFYYLYHILLGASASWALTPVGHINRCQRFHDSVRPADTRSSSSLTSVYPRIKFPSRRLLLHTNDMADLAQPWILISYITFMSLRSSYSSQLYQMGKSSPTLTGSQILRRSFLSNTIKAAASVKMHG